jgi:hypothetical protein
VFTFSVWAVRTHGVVIARQALITFHACRRSTNQFWFKHSSRTFPLKLSNERVLHVLPALDAVQRDPVLIRPLIHDAAGELSSTPRSHGSEEVLRRDSGLRCLLYPIATGGIDKVILGDLRPDVLQELTASDGSEIMGLRSCTQSHMLGENFERPTCSPRKT